MPQRLHPSTSRAPSTDGRPVVLPRRPRTAGLLLGAVLGALVATVAAGPAAPSAGTLQANRGWNAPPDDAADRLDRS